MMLSIDSRTSDTAMLKKAAQCLVIAVAENDVMKLKSVIKHIGKE